MQRFRHRLLARIDLKIDNLRARGLDEQVELVAGDAANLELLGKRLPGRLILIDHRVEGFVAVLRQHGAPQDVAAHKHLFADARDLHGAVGHDTHHVVEDGTLLHELVLAPVEADEALLAVDIEALVG